MRVMCYEDYKKVYPECPAEVPNDILSERHTAVVHGKTFRKMNEAGGMTLGEMALNIENELDYKKMKGDSDALDVVLSALKRYELSRLQQT